MIFNGLFPAAGARLCRRNPPPIFFSPRRKENGPRPVQKKRRWDEQAGRLFVSAGVGRIGPAGIDGPVVPVPDPGGRKPLVPHGSCGEKTGWSSDLLLLLFPRLPLRQALAGQSMRPPCWVLGVAGRSACRSDEQCRVSHFSYFIVGADSISARRPGTHRTSGGPQPLAGSATARAARSNRAAVSDTRRNRPGSA